MLPWTVLTKSRRKEYLTSERAILGEGLGRGLDIRTRRIRVSGSVGRLSGPRKRRLVEVLSTTICFKQNRARPLSPTQLSVYPTYQTQSCHDLYYISSGLLERSQGSQVVVATAMRNRKPIASPVDRPSFPTTPPTSSQRLSSPQNGDGRIRPATDLSSDDDELDELDDVRPYVISRNNSFELESLSEEAHQLEPTTRNAS